MPISNLQQLNQGLPGITPTFGSAIAEAAKTCLRSLAHEPGVILTFEGKFLLSSS